MKKRLYLGGVVAALSLTLLLAGCGVITSDDGPTAVIDGGGTTLVDLPQGAVPGEDGPSEPETRTENPAPEEDSGQAEDSGTGNGEEDSLYEDGFELDADGTYNSAEEVALYLDTYGHLPSNYITKREARELGWSGGSVEQVAPGKAIGGDAFGNREGVLPDGKYHECDIDTIGESSRGAKRIVYSDDGRIYYTEDHYETFTLLYGEE